MKQNKKTILLVLGVAVLLVSVVGATYAFFNAQNATSQSIGAEVNTQTGDTSTFLVSGDLSFTADDTTFSESSGDKSTTATGRVVFRAGSENASGSDLCYTVKVNMTSNNFNYTNSSSYPELVLQAKYADTTTYTTVAPVLDITSNSLHEYNSAIGTVPYVTVPVAAANNETGYVGRNTAISGYDVTTNTTTFYIPYASGNNVYKIHAAAGATVEQDWVFKLNFINYEWNQADITNANNNNNKTFDGQIVFEQTICPTASAPTYAYWTNDFISDEYNSSSMPNSAENSNASFVSDWRKYYIRTTLVNNAPIEHKTCLYDGNKDIEFCIGANYWDTDAATTITKLSNEMKEVLNTNNVSCEIEDSEEIKCYYRDIEYVNYGKTEYFYFSVYNDGKVACGGGGYDCNVYPRDDDIYAYCY